MVLPAECDEALDALREARLWLGHAVDALRALDLPVDVVDVFTKAMDATSWSVENVASAVTKTSSAARRDRDMEAVEERHIDAQLFPEVDDW